MPFTTSTILNLNLTPLLTSLDFLFFPSLCFVDESKNSVDSSELKEEIENIEPKNNETTNENKEKNKKSSDVNNGVKFKFKIVEVINGILD